MNLPPIEIHNIPLAVVFAIAGLGVFLFAIRVLSGSLKSMTSGFTVNLLKKFSAKPWLGLIFGFIFTSIIQSSDGAIALAIGLLGAGMMNMKATIAFLLGANIGTSTTSLIVWLSSSNPFTQYFMIAVFIGVMALMVVKEEKSSNIATLVVSFGLIFVGLKMLGWGMDTVGSTQEFRSVFKAVAVNPWSGLFSSMGLTALMQSSSASITMIQHMYAGAADSSALLPSAIAMIFGANIGTTFTAFVISIGGNKDARRIAFIWFLTNSIFALLFMFMVYPWDGYGSMISSIVSQPVGQLAMAHLFFNLVLSCTFIFFVKQLSWLSYKVISPTKSKFPYEVNLQTELIEASPETAFLSAKKATRELGNMSHDSIKMMIKYYKDKDKATYSTYKSLLELIEYTRKNLYSYMVDIGSKNISRRTANRQLSMTLAIRSLERVPLLGYEVIKSIKAVVVKGTSKLHTEDYKNILELLVVIADMTELSSKQISRYSKERAAKIENKRTYVDDKIVEFSALHIERTRSEKFEYDFILLLKQLSRMSHHANRVSRYLKTSLKDISAQKIPTKLREQLTK